MDNRDEANESKPPAKKSKLTDGSGRSDQSTSDSAPAGTEVDDSSSTEIPVVSASPEGHASFRRGPGDGSQCWERSGAVAPALLEPLDRQRAQLTALNDPATILRSAVLADAIRQGQLQQQLQLQQQIVVAAITQHGLAMEPRSSPLLQFGSLSPTMNFGFGSSAAPLSSNAVDRLTRSLLHIHPTLTALLSSSLQPTLFPLLQPSLATLAGIQPGDTQQWICQSPNSQSDVMPNAVLHGSASVSLAVTSPSVASAAAAAPTESTRKRPSAPSSDRQGSSLASEKPDVRARGPRQPPQHMRNNNGMASSVSEPSLTPWPEVNRGPDSTTTRRVFPVACDSDETSVSRYQRMLRLQMEFFEADRDDVEASARGRNVPLTIGQVGIRCIHCARESNRCRGSVYYPIRLSSLYQAVQNMANNHFMSGVCPNAPEETVREIAALKARKPRQKTGTGNRYWVQSAQSLGIFDAEETGLVMRDHSGSSESGVNP